MNKRIRELESQCWEERKYGPAWFNSEKFAELILTEVTDILTSYRGKVVFEDGAEYNYEHPIVSIRKHFGVEE